VHFCVKNDREKHVFCVCTIKYIKMQSSHNIRAMGMYHVSTLLHYKGEEWIECSPSIRSDGDLNAWNVFLGFQLARVWNLLIDFFGM